MINLNEKYIKITDDVSISNAWLDGVKCKVINFNHNSLMSNHDVEIFCNIKIVEDKYVIDPITGDKIAYGEWFDLDKVSLIEYSKKVEDVLNSSECASAV